jgi:hypothetical protein
VAGGTYFPIPTLSSTPTSTPAPSGTTTSLPSSTAAQEALLSELEATMQGPSGLRYTNNLAGYKRSGRPESLQHYLNTHGFPVVSTPPMRDH